MKKAKKWAEEFFCLDEKEQLEIAKFIIEELEVNESISKDTESFTYDCELSANIRSSLEKLKEYLEVSISTQKINELFERISSLSDDNLRKLSKDMAGLLKSSIKKQKKAEKKETCARVGHDFTLWEHNEWTTFEDVVIDHQHVDGYPIPHENWTKKCRRCGFVETTEKEPKEVKEARIQMELEQERKTLQKRLNEINQKLK